MGELSQFINRKGKLPSNCVIQYPSGRWGFTGSVDIRLSFIGIDGHLPITERELDTIRRCGPGFCKTVRGRSWADRQSAIDEAISLGLEVTE